MSDWNDARVSGDSPEAVAWALMVAIAHAEDKHYSNKLGDDREWILDTYADCLNVAKGGRFAP